MLLHAALYNASMYGRKDIVELLLAKGVDPNLIDTFSETALMISSATGHTSVAKALIAQGANVDMRDIDGYTALTYAAYHGHKEAVKLLLSHKCDVNLQNNDGSTALFLSSQVCCLFNFILFFLLNSFIFFLLLERTYRGGRYAHTKWSQCECHQQQRKLRPMPCIRGWVHRRGEIVDKQQRLCKSTKQRRIR